MKYSKTVYYKDLSDELKNKVDIEYRTRELERRSIYYPTITQDEKELPWYFKSKYINEWKHNDNALLDFCPVCNEYEGYSTFIKEVGYMTREVTVKCNTCNTYYSYNG